LWLRRQGCCLIAAPTPPSVIEILLVEDDPNDVLLTTHALGMHHVANHIEVVKDGQEALDCIFGEGRFTGRPLNLRVVLLDLHLPKVDGLEVLKRIRADERTKLIPVVVMTSSRAEADRLAGYESGANSFIVKPVDFDQFTETVRTLGMYWVLMNEPPRT